MTSATSSEPVPADAPTGAEQPGTTLSGPERDRALAVLGMIAFGELAAFSRLAADAALAPTLAQRLALSRLAGVALARIERVGERVTALGAELQPVMEPFAGVLVEFDERTTPGTWWERLLKGYVGFGVSDDFSRMIAQGLDPWTRGLVEDLLANDAHGPLVVGILAEAATTDATLDSRLALWGRRLVGEALGVVQRVVSEHAELRALLEPAMAGTPGTGDAQQRLHSALTAEHTRRMERLGLTP